MCRSLLLLFCGMCIIVWCRKVVLLIVVVCCCVFLLLLVLSELLFWCLLWLSVFVFGVFYLCIVVDCHGLWCGV